MSSRFAVLLLLFFIVGTIIFEPLLAKGSLYGSRSGSSYASHTPRRPYVMLSGGFLVAANRPILDSQSQSPVIDPKTKKVRLLVTAYSSSPDETDDTPWVTASGTHTGYGVVATNYLPLGTRIRLPKIFGNQVFIVEDRMNARYNSRIDVWLPTKAEAIRFGEKFTEISVL
ncbi:hypothetical protein HY504_01615 [Candidatus Wolfebacteria bacterium]|nr:hypothetical protein [Candidatus Wolfebacteria bacterium]